MRAKDWLRDVRRMAMALERKMELLERWETRATNITQQLKPDRIQSSNDGAEELLAKIADLSKEIRDEMEFVFAQQSMARHVIDQLEKESHKDVLYLRYLTPVRKRNLNRDEWQLIADELGYERRYTIRLHGYALRELNQVLDENRH